MDSNTVRFPIRPLFADELPDNGYVSPDTGHVAPDIGDDPPSDRIVPTPADEFGSKLAESLVREAMRRLAYGAGYDISPKSLDDVTASLVSAIRVISTQENMRLALERNRNGAPNGAA